MPELTINRFTAGAVLLTALVAVLSVLFLVAEIGSTQEQAPVLTIDSASAEILAEKGIVLRQPSASAQPDVPEAEAVKNVSISGAVPQEVTLARLQIKNVEPSVDKLVWVVELDPKTVVLESFGGSDNAEFFEKNPDWAKAAVESVIYAISFIDADTGEELYLISRRATEFPGLTPAPDQTISPDTEATP